MAPILTAPDGRLRNGWKVLLFLALTAACVAVLLSLRRAGLPLPDTWLTFAGALLATWICVRREGTRLAEAGLRWEAVSARQCLFGLALGAGLLATTALLVRLLGGFHLVPAEQVRVADILTAGFGMLGAVLFEETVFRGYAFQRAVQGLGERRALIVFGLLFVAAHPIAPELSTTLQWSAALNLFLAAQLLGLGRLRTGALALPVGLHLGWNWGMESLGFAVSGNPLADALWEPVFDRSSDWLTGGAIGLEASALSLPVLGAAVLWFALRPPAGLQSRP